MQHTEKWYSLWSVFRGAGKLACPLNSANRFTNRVVYV